MLSEGYYFVVLESGREEIACYESGYWTLCGESYRHHTADFKSIGQRVTLPCEEKKGTQ